MARYIPNAVIVLLHGNTSLILMPRITTEPRHSLRKIVFSNGSWWFLDPERNRNVCLDRLFKSCEWNLGSLCDTLGIEKRTFARITERSLGINGKFWLRQIRIVAASHLLRENCKIESVAQALGFRYFSDFTREFNKLMGVSPSRYVQEECSRSIGFDGEGIKNQRSAESVRFLICHFFLSHFYCHANSVGIFCEQVT